VSSHRIVPLRRRAARHGEGLKQAILVAARRLCFAEGVDGVPMVLANVIWSQIHGLAALTIAGRPLLTAPGHAADLLETVLDSIARGVLRTT
jgi:hypothetical protein